MSLDDLAQSVAQGRVASHVAVGFAKRTRGSWRFSSGGEVETFFDLASVTKPVCALAIARLRGLRERPTGQLVPEALGSPSSQVAIELLLAHRAGLQAHVPLFLPLVTGARFDARDALRTAAQARRPDALGPLPSPEGFAPLYSDLGYALAGDALAAAVGARDAGLAMSDRILAPLGLEGTMGTARELGLSDGDDRAAPTEEAPWRGGVVRGRVHDENAWALTGAGGSGHAGLFGTIDAVLRFGAFALDRIEGRASAAGEDDASWLVRERPGGTLRAGFDGKSAVGSSAGERMGARAFGHLGFTGTSLWIDPDAEVVVALLTNRVHPTRDNARIRECRPRVHDELHRLATR